MLKILIGTPIHQIKDYAMERWLQNVAKLQAESPADLLLVDNSPNLDYVEKVKGYCAKYGIHPVRSNPAKRDAETLFRTSNGVTNYRIEHLDIGDLQGRDEKIARSREIIRQYILAHDYDVWFSWESDQIIPPQTLIKLVRIMEAGKYTMIHPNSWGRVFPYEPDVSFGVCLIKRAPLEKHTFLLDTPALRNSWYGGEEWFKKQVLADGGSYVEIYGIIKPIYHLDK